MPQNKSWRNSIDDEISVPADDVYHRLLSVLGVRLEREDCGIVRRSREREIGGVTVVEYTGGKVFRRALITVSVIDVVRHRRLRGRRFLGDHCGNRFGIFEAQPEDYGPFVGGLV